MYKQREAAAQTRGVAKELTVRACRQDLLGEFGETQPCFYSSYCSEIPFAPISVTAALRPPRLLAHRAANRSIYNVPCYCADGSKQLLIFLDGHKPSMFKALTRLNCHVCPQRSHSDSVSQCLTSLWSHFRRFMIKVMFSYQG